MKTFQAFLILLTLTAIVGCKDNSTNSAGSTYTGTPMTMGAGTANSWITTNTSGNLSAIGVTISDAALTSLGSNDTMLELPMPTGFSSSFKSISLAYSNHDAAPYNKPHLDPHFFLIDMNARMNIMSGMDGMMPTNMMMPSGFMSDSVSEAMMGVHWMDTTAAEYHGMPFQCTFDYGFSKGSMVFLEVMSDKASMLTHTALGNTVRKVTMMGGMTMSTPLPSSYKVSYDAVAHTSTIELDGF